MQSRRRDWITGLPPRFKMLGALVLIIGISALPNRLGAVYLVPLGLLALFAALARLSPRFALKRMLLAQVFILGIGLLSLFGPGQAAIALAALSKSNLCVFTLILLTWTTAFTEILLLLRSAGLPPLMLTTLALIVRYMPVLTGEARRMQRARASRSFLASRSFEWHNLAFIAGSLFRRSNRRAERIYLAMCSRGWR